jgi:NDP-sugar pyrophosphorylase family protein
VSLTLVVMAAGLGSRFGGPKQLEPVGPSNETLIDYVLFDARRAGFDRAVLVIREELESAAAAIAARHAWRLRATIARQIGGPHVPRGTVPAVLAAGDHVDGPFAALNADDFYGVEAYRQAARFLRDSRAPANSHAVVALPLASTLSPHRGVVRAVCDTNEDELVRLDEVRGVERKDDAIVAGDRLFTGRERVSMNFWAFQRGVLAELAREFDKFARSHDARDELPLPVAVDVLIADRRARVRVLDAPGPWLGLTHPSDLPAVRAALHASAERGDYPTPLWLSPRAAHDRVSS